MANIQEYNPGGLGLQPSETGEQAFAAAGRRVGAFYNQTGQEITNLGQQVSGAIKDAGDVYVKYQEHKDISKASADFAQLQDNLINQWNDTAKNADPNDPTVAQKFRENVLEPQLENFGSDLQTEGGQNFALSHVNALRQHMFEKTAADMSTLAGVAAKVNAEKTINSLSNTVMNDPSSLDHALSIADSSISGLAGSSPTLSATDSARVKSELGQHAKEQIVKSAAFGAIQKTGEMPDWISDPKYAPYVNGMELKQFQTYAKVQAKSNALMDKQSQLLQRQIAEQNVRASSAKTITDNVTFDPQTGTPIIDPKFFKQALDIARNNPDAPNAAETVRTMMSWGESQQNKAAKPVDDPTVKTDLMDRMFSADNPTTTLDLMKARVEHKISDQSFQAMHGLVTELEQSPLKGEIWKSTTSAVKSQLIRTDIMGDKVGSDLYASFIQAFLPEYLAKSRTGSLPPNALDLSDPKSMISQALSPYRASMQDRLLHPNATPQEASPPAAKPEAPPMEGARKAADGNWYVQKDGKYYRVDK